MRYVTLDEAADSAGVVVVVDVLRAFTVAALALARGATAVRCVATVPEALAERTRRPGTLAMGEEQGRPVAGFDLSNSPTHLLAADVAGRPIVHRSTAGTQGVVRAAPGAEALFAASFVCAAATARAVAALQPPQVTFVLTGVDERDGEEDRACAEYIAALLSGGAPDAGPYLARVRASDAARLFLDGDPDFPAADLDAATQLDAVGFALGVTLDGGAPVLRPVT